MDLERNRQVKHFYHQATKNKEVLFNWSLRIVIIPNNFWSINDEIIKIDFFKCIKRPVAFIDLFPESSSTKSSNACINAG